jgi:hypothetical protein
VRRVLAALALCALALTACSAAPLGRQPLGPAPGLRTIPTTASSRGAHPEATPLAPTSSLVKAVGLGNKRGTSGRRGGAVTCGADTTAAWNAYLAGLPANSTITLPFQACYNVSGFVSSTSGLMVGLLMKDKKNLTIHGNGATFQALSPPQLNPIMEVYANNNVKIDHLTINGPGCAQGCGGGTELDYGLYMESNNGFVMTNSTVENVRGDWVITQGGFDTSGDPNAFAENTAVTFNQDTFLHAGYHGFTNEATGCLTAAPCNGLTIENSTMTDMNVDAMDWEVDVSSSSVCAGVPCGLVQNNVNIVNNTWSAYGDVWFASLQGQTPGVAEQNQRFIGNKLINTDSAGFFDVNGTSATVAGADARFLDSNWTIQNNTVVNATYDGAFQGRAILFENVYRLTMTNNFLPQCLNVPVGLHYYQCTGAPSGQYVGSVYGGSGSITNNNLANYNAVFTTDSSTFGWAERCNIIGYQGTQTTPGCPTGLGAPAGYSTANLTFDDMFNGPILNTNAGGWSNGFTGSSPGPIGAGHTGTVTHQTYFSPNEVTVNNGLNLGLDYDTTYTSSGFNTRGGAISSKWTINSGYVQVRARFESSLAGQGPGIWLSSFTAGSGAAEIDMHEAGFLYNETGAPPGTSPDFNYAMNFHQVNGTQGVAYQPGVNWYNTDLTKYNTYGMEVNPSAPGGGTVKYYLNGTLMAVQTGNVPNIAWTLFIWNAFYTPTQSGYHTVGGTGSGLSVGDNLTQVSEVQVYSLP